MITANQHNVLYKVISLETGEYYVLKILSKKYFCKSLYQTIFSFKNKHLLLPAEEFRDASYVYFITPYFDTLGQVLSTRNFSFAEIRQLSEDIGQAVSALHQAGILHLDITPQNIYLDKNHHFYLGDFSSSCYADKNFLLSFYYKKKVYRTRSRTTFSLPEQRKSSLPAYYQDLYQISLLLFMLLHNGNLPENISLADISPFTPADNIFQKIFFVADNVHTDELPKTKQPLYSTEAFFASLAEAFALCDKERLCREYKIALSDASVAKSDIADILNDTTLEMISHEKEEKGLASMLFLFAGCLFLFSLYQVVAPKVKEDTFSKKQDYVISVATGSALEKTTASSAPSPVENAVTKSPTPSQSENTVTASSTPSPVESAVTESPVSSPVENAIMASPVPSPSGTLDCTLNIANKSYADLSSSDLSSLHVTTATNEIKIVIASHNLFNNSSTFESFTSLQELYLDNNKICSLSGLSELKKLKILSLSDNKLCDITELSKITSLSILDISGNKNIKNIRTLSTLKKLQYLVITDTNITKKEVSFLQKKLPLCTILY